MHDTILTNEPTVCQSILTARYLSAAQQKIRQTSCRATPDVGFLFKTGFASSLVRPLRKKATSLLNTSDKNDKNSDISAETTCQLFGPKIH